MKSILMRIEQWLCAKSARFRSFDPSDPAVSDLVERVETLEERAVEQERRVDHVEARLGIRSAARWRQRDAG